MKTKHLLLSLMLLSLVIFAILAAQITQDNYFSLAKSEILMRKIGHELLLNAGDSTSRVLPVTKLHAAKYRIQFENPFKFEPDTLVRIISKTLARHETSDYIVNVLDCSNNAVVYGYAMAADKKNDVLSCLGREQVSACYLVTVEFGNVPFGIKKYAAAVSLLAFVGLCPFVVVGYRRRKSVASQIPKASDRLTAMGKLLFDKDNKQLITPTETLKLTAKETRLLDIFAQNPNQIIDRARLQKEIWEDDGIIVGRSLDVFISKLRKKLESDTQVQLVNIHGKGYRLQIEAVKI
ncbi:MAG TPA: winged helix-turn-helix domain-containing protein [Flavobacterium sp.]|nr:winged helix-turn-helix domain-containing protein [Flavobacterium sp.]